MKKQENLVKVKDPNGRLFELPQRNAVDLVQQFGWVLDTKETPYDLNARAPRNIKSSRRKLEESRRISEDSKKVENSEKNAVETAPVSTRRGGKGRPKKVEDKSPKSDKAVVIENETPSFTEDAGEDYTPYDLREENSLDDELSDLESEESDRSPDVKEWLEGNE